MSRRRQQTAVAKMPEEWVGSEGSLLDLGATGEAQQDTLGVRGRACGESWIRNRRGPTRWSSSDRTDPYKPMAKWGRAGRESEGLTVPMRPGETREEGRGPTSVMPVVEGTCEGMPSGLGCGGPTTRTLKHDALDAGYTRLPSFVGERCELGISLRTPWGDDHGGPVASPLARSACGVRRPLVSRMREIRTYGSKGGFRRGR